MNKQDRLKEIHAFIKEKGFTIESIDEYTQHKLKLSHTSWLLIYGLTLLVFFVYLYNAEK